MATADSLLGYAKVTLHEMAVQATMTATLRQLFNLKMMVKNCSETTMQNWPEIKERGEAQLHAVVARWLATEDDKIKRIFREKNFTMATFVLTGRDEVRCTVDDKRVVIPTQSIKHATQVQAAIDLLRYPLIVLEALLMGKQGEKLCLDADLPLLLEKEQNLAAEAAFLERLCGILQVKAVSDDEPVAKRVKLNT